MSTSRMESKLIDVIDDAIENNMTPADVIERLGELWEIELRERADRIRATFEGLRK